MIKTVLFIQAMWYAITHSISICINVSATDVFIELTGGINANT